MNPRQQKKLMDKISTMISVTIAYNKEVLGYAHFRKPVSFQQFIKKIDYSIVVTDQYKIPLYWRNMNIPENKSYSELTAVEQKQLNQKALGMYEIPISNDADSLGYAYFATSTSLSRIRYLVYLEFILMALIILFRFYGLMLLKRTEKDSLWVGLAKETAHQFGTPITSLMGWVDYLKTHPGGFHTEKEYEQFVEWMTADLEKLKTIASRFGKVGSTIKLVPEDLHGVLNEIVDYFRERLPHQGSRIQIHLISKINGIKVLMDVDLFRWTMENLIKNCIDTLGKKGGNIIITASSKDPWVYVHIMDEGKGIPRSMWKKIFDPGTTTKTRGWGLGLSLAKRIIEEYHQGKIRVIESTIGEGTTFEIMLHREDNPKG